MNNTHAKYFFSILLLVVIFWTNTHAEDQSSQKRGSSHPMKWYRGAIHTHTIRSDGNAFPETALDVYRQLGYQFVALTDHHETHQKEKWTRTDWLQPWVVPNAMKEQTQRFSQDRLVTREKDGKTEVRLRSFDELASMFNEPGKFLVISGEEMSPPSAHVGLLGNRTTIPSSNGSPTEVIERCMKALDQWTANGEDVLGIVNHPNGGWMVTVEDLLAVKDIRFIEVCNAAGPGCQNEGDALHPSVDRMWDIVNTVRIIRDRLPPVYGVASDDAHSYFTKEWIGGRTNLGWIMVRAKQLSSAAIFAAMRKGDFYGSTGVQLESVEFDPATRELRVAVAPEAPGEYTITFIGSRVGVDISGREVSAVDKDGKALRLSKTYDPAIGQTFKVVKGRQASYRLAKEDLYVRAVVDRARPPTKDGNPCRAWTQPIGWITPSGAPELQPATSR